MNPRDGTMAPAPAPSTQTGPRATSAAAPGALGREAQSRRATWGYRVHRLLQRLSGGQAGLQAYLFCAQPIGSGAFGALRADPHTTVRRVQADDPLLAELPRPPEAMARRRAAGTECFAATVKGRFAGCIWIAHGHYDEDEVHCRYQLPPGPPASVWDFDVYVAPDFRGGRTLARLWHAVDQALAQDGVRYSCSRISLYNPASILAHERLGARLVGSGWFLLLGPWQIAWLDGRLHAGRRGAPAAPPTLRVPLP